MRCQLHLDCGVQDAAINEGVCNQCLMRQSLGSIERASLSVLHHYLEMKSEALKTAHETEVKKLFNAIFAVATKAYSKEQSLIFLSNALMNLAKSHFVTEQDIEEAYGKVRGFEENQ